MEVDQGANTMGVSTSDKGFNCSPGIGMDRADSFERGLADEFRTEGEVSDCQAD